MDHFTYRDGRLLAEDVPLETIARAVGTPFYCYSTATLERHYRAYADAFAGLPATICYAVKANPNTAVIRTLARLGAGADVVSGGELKRALAGGVEPRRIVFSGVGKSRDELAAALDAGILQINVESEPELEALSEVARSKGVTAPVAIRVNPDIDAGTHEKITTGRRENKFGIEWTRAHEVYSKVRAMPGLAVAGVAVHIGSQLLDLKPYRDAYTRLRDLIAMLRADGHELPNIDLGGGLGVPYQGEIAPSPAEYAAVVREVMAGVAGNLILEPGRSIAGNAGVLVARVIYIKEGATRRFVILDAAMNDLIRPAMYGARHELVPVAEPAPGARVEAVDVVGPVCESGDTFAKEVPLPPLAAGDLVVLRTAGAYGAAMASMYNARALAPEVMVKGGEFAVVRQRIQVDDVLAREHAPAWLEG
jgi:diaminopimelate decarboxylase